MSGEVGGFLRFFVTPTKHEKGLKRRQIAARKAIIQMQARAEKGAIKLRKKEAKAFAKRAKPAAKKRFNKRTEIIRVAPERPKQMPFFASTKRQSPRQRALLARRFDEASRGFF